MEYASARGSEQQEARQTAILLEAVAREAERLGRRETDPGLRDALLSRARRAREDAAHLRAVLEQPAA